MSKEEFVTRFLADQQARKDAKKEAEKDYWEYRMNIYHKKNKEAMRRYYTSRKFI